MIAPGVRLVLLAIGALAALAPLDRRGALAASPSASRDKAPAKDQLARDLDKVFAGRSLRFCHDPDFPLTLQEAQWCELVPADDKRCPALRKACAAGVRAQHKGWRQSLDLDLPQLPPLAGALVWAVLIGLCGVVIFLLLKSALERRRAPESRAGDRPPPAGAVLTDEAARAVETDVLRLLERARAAAAAGDYRQAVADVYAAMLRKLEGASLIRVEAHRTNGDYLRALGERQPALRARVGEVVAEVERSEFGGEPPGAERFRFIHDRVLAMASERLGLWLPLLLAVLGGGSAGCQAERAGWDDSPSGRSALRGLLAASGLQVGERLADLQKLDDQVNTLVLLPEAQMKEGDWEHLRTWTLEGGTLVLAGKPPQPPAWIEARFVDAGRDASPVVPAAHPPKAKPRATPAPAVTIPPGRWRVASEGGRPMLARGAGHYALQLGPDEEGQGRVLVFADDRLFCNAALLAPLNARYLVSVLSAGGKRLQFAGEMMGVVSRTPLEAVSRGRLAPVMLQLALAALLFFVYRGAHFGRPRPEPPVRRRAFADHVRALGLTYARARAGRVSLEHYGAWATERLGERLRMGGATRLSAIAEGIAARTGRPVGEVMRLLVEGRPGDGRAASTLNSTEEARQSAEAMNDLRALAALVVETGAQRQRPPSETRSQ